MQDIRKALGQRVFLLLIGVLSVALTGCMTTGYSRAKNPNQVQKWDVTVISVEPQNIYNSLGVSLVGPFASVDAKGLRVKFIADGEKKPSEIVQPSSDRFDLTVGQRAVFIVDRGEAWVQPADYPLPPEFTHSVVIKKPETDASTMAPSPAPVAPASTKDTNKSADVAVTKKDDLGRLEKLKELRDKGVISQKDYEKKKQEILDSL